MGHRLIRCTPATYDVHRELVCPCVGADFQDDLHVNEILEKEYGLSLKALPYVGSDIYNPQMKRLSRGWFNSLATFGGQSEDALHGTLGRDTNGVPLWVPAEMPPPIDSPSVCRLNTD